MEALNVRHEIRVSSVAIQRDFDTVWNAVLLFKLSPSGIQGQLHTWLHYGTSSTLTTNVWHSAESFHLLSLSRLELYKAVIWVQCYS